MDVYEFLRNPTPEIYLKDHITIDCETTNINYGDSTKEENRLVCTTILDIDVSTVFGGLGHLDSIIARMESIDGFSVGHNIKFDLRWLARYGLDLSKIIVWDTMIAEHVFYGNRDLNRIPIDLGSVAKRYGLSGKEPFVDKCIKGGICPSEIPHSLLKRRNQYDVTTTDFVFRQQLQRAIKEDKLKTILTRCLLTPVLADIEIKGLCLDSDVVNTEYTKAINAKVEIDKQLSAIADINWSSPKQVGELIYDKLGFKELEKHGKVVKTDSGRYKADVATIRNLKAKTKEQKLVQKLLDSNSVIQAQLSKTLSKFKLCVDNNDLLYAQFNQAVTQTHRLSSTGTEYGVQFQNMPRIFKPCVKARYEGWELWEADGAQLEFRVAAYLGQDPVAINDIATGADVHSVTASTITEAGQPTTRQEAKAHTFKPLSIAA